MNDDDFLVSAVMAARDEGEEVDATVESAIEAAQGKPIQVIVSDDCSKKPVWRVKDLARDNAEVIVIRGGRPRGAGMARNIGFAAATGAVVVSTDAHMRYPKGIWHRLGKFVRENRCIATACVAAMTGGKQGAGGLLNYHREGKIGVDYFRPKKKADGAWESGPTKVTAPYGAFYMMPRDIYDRMTRWPSTTGIWGYEETAVGSWAYFHDVPIFSFPQEVCKHWFRSEIKKGGVNYIPWGTPPTDQLWLNIAMSHLALFEPETVEKVWQPHIDVNMTPSTRKIFDMAKDGKLYETGIWRKGKMHTDYEYFRDVMRMPAERGKTSGSVKRLRPISLIITARDEGKEVANTVVSAVRMGQVPYEIIVVDDASSDGCCGPDFWKTVHKKVYAHWRESLPARLRVIRHEVPVGVTQSRHEAIEAARGEVFVIFDAHQRVKTRYGVETLASYANDTGGVVVAAVCNLDHADKTEKRTWGAQLVCKPKWGLYNRHISTKPKETEMYLGKLMPRNAVIGGAYAITKEAIDRMGGWPQFPGVWAYNEQWVALRAWELDIPMHCLTSVTIEHKYNDTGPRDYPHYGTLMNAHYVHYVHFGDEAYEGFFKPCLLMHGWDDRVDKFLGSDYVQDMRAKIAGEKEKNGKTDQQFFSDFLGIDTWPPKWEGKEARKK